MSMILTESHFIWGVPNPLPKIEGYQVVANRKAWLQARDADGIYYFVESFPDHWRLRRDTNGTAGEVAKVIPK